MKKILTTIIVIGLSLAFLFWYRSIRQAKHPLELILKEIVKQSEAEPISPLVKKALSIIQAKNIPPGIAVDFGPGFGKETKYLLENGYQIIAVDDFAPYLKIITDQVAGTPYKDKLTTIHSKFEDLDWTAIPQVDLFIASFSLTTLPKNKFQKVWPNIVAHIKPGGYFAGHIPTHHTPPEGPSKVPIFSKEEIKNLFEDFDIEYFDNAYALGDSPSTPEPDDPYSVIARKKS